MPAQLRLSPGSIHMLRVNGYEIPRTLEAAIPLGDCAFTAFGRLKRLSGVTDGPVLMELLRGRSSRPSANHTATPTRAASAAASSSGGTGPSTQAVDAMRDLSGVVRDDWLSTLEQRVLQHPTSTLQYRAVVNAKSNEAQEISRLHFVVRRETTAANPSHPDARLTSDGFVYSIIDMGSINGTFVDGTRISSLTWTPLREGTVVRLAWFKKQHVRMLRLLREFSTKTTKEEKAVIKAQMMEKRLSLNELCKEFVFERAIDNATPNSVEDAMRRLSMTSVDAASGAGPSSR